MNKLPDFRILVIDDNPDIHHDFIKILTLPTESKGLDALSGKMFGTSQKTKEEQLLPNFQIDTASQGQEGVECIKKAIIEKNPYSLAFVDIRMPPGWDGIETIKCIWELDRDIQIVICTAYSDYSWEETVAHLGKTDNLLILKKPFDSVSVRQLACALTKKWQLLQSTRDFTSTLKQQVNERTLSLQKSLSLVKATLESSDEGIVVFGVGNKVVDCNQKFCTMWNVKHDMVNTKNENEFLDYMKSQLSDPHAFEKWIEAMQLKSDTFNIDVIKFKDGRVFDCYSQPQKINEEVVGRVLNFRDITERNKLESELQYQAKHDALTGLPNRVLLFEKFQEAILKAKIDDSLCALLFFDLDRFKLINDSLSHAAGDELLCYTAQRLKSVISGNDTLARLGGDEFVILLTEQRSYEAIAKKAQEVISIFQEPFFIADRNVSITSSIGISVFPKNGTNADTLLRNADVAMYAVKESGSNNFKFYSEDMNVKSLEKLDQEILLRQAITNNELFLCYQPQMDLSKEKLIAVEALLRWRHPKKGILLPMDFVPLAEDTGLIVSIGEWVLRTACKQNKAWQKQGLPLIRMAVNISAIQLKQQNIVATVKSILEEIELEPKYLEIELTENIIISSAEVMNTVTELKKLGIIIAIDDFGTGYSSLSYLKNLPLDRLKIDSSFIRHIETEKDDEVIIRAIIAIAKNLNLEVLAEGVETKNQLEFLKNQNCDEIQGFFYSKPLSSEDLEKLLKDPKSLKEAMTFSE